MQLSCIISLRPLVDLIESFGVPRFLAVLLIYFFIGVIATIVFFIVGPKVVNEFISITTFSPEKMESLKASSGNLFEQIKAHISSQFPEVQNIFFSYLQKINSVATQIIINTISTIASIAIALAITPFVLYYFLRDDNLFSKFVVRYVPSEFKEEVQKILKDIDGTLSEFILAQMTVALVVGFFLFLWLFFDWLTPSPLSCSFCHDFLYYSYIGNFYCHYSSHHCRVNNKSIYGF